MRKVHLISILGKGQGGEDKYKTADYSLDHKEPFQTPFVGEAIIHQSPVEFDLFHILGTKDSMWDELYLYCSDKKQIPGSGAIIEQLINLKGSYEIKEQLKKVAHAFEALTGVSGTCHLIPAEADPGSIWELFSLIKEIPDTNDSVWLDVTHGLRHQPITALLALYFFSQIKGIRIESISYGAFEQKNPQTGIVPIVRFDEISRVLDWVIAARDFAKYGNSQLLASLIKNEEEIVQNINGFSEGLQFLQFGKLKRTAKFITEYEAKITESQSIPLKAIEPLLKEKPNEIHSDGDKPTYRYLFHLAKMNFENGVYSASTIYAWQAIIERIKSTVSNAFLVSLLEPVSNRNRKYNPEYEIEKLVALIFAEGEKNLIKTDTFPDAFTDLGEFFKAAGRVHELRNAAAHATQISQEFLGSQLGNDLKYIEKFFEDAIWEKYTENENLFESLFQEAASYANSRSRRGFETSG